MYSTGGKKIVTQMSFVKFRDEVQIYPFQTKTIRKEESFFHSLNLIESQIIDRRSLESNFIVDKSILHLSANKDHSLLQVFGLSW